MKSFEEFLEEEIKAPSGWTTSKSKTGHTVFKKGDREFHHSAGSDGWHDWHTVVKGKVTESGSDPKNETKHVLRNFSKNKS